MIDLDDLIAEARSRANLCSQDAREAMRDTGDIVTRLADALEAATSVPVPGEPNDDRENLITERTYGHGSITLTHYRSSGRIGVVQRGENSVMDVTDLLMFLQDSGLDEDFSRAFVPDAATDDMSVPEFCEALGFVDGSTRPARLRDIVEPIQWWDSEARDHVECARICEQCGETLARTPCGECHGGGQRDGGNGTVRECGNCGGAGWLHEGCAEVSYADLVAERDAAVAAIKRAQETLSLHNPNGRLVKEVLAALDGAPEPEWEYGMQDDYGLSFVGNIAEAYDHANRQDPELNPRPVRRRKAGPWEPVWGESKP